MMTEEQILQLAEHYMTFSWDETFKATSKQVLNFARAMYESYDNEGYSNCSLDMGDENV